MKSQFFLSMIIGWIFIFMDIGLFAQENIKALPSVTVTSTSNVTKQVNKSFGSAFKEAIDPHWYKLNRDYFVKFIMDDQKNTALMQKNGRIIYHIKYGTEVNLPDDVRKLAKSNFVEYNITNAINVEQDQRNIWVINMEDSKKFVIVRVESGEVEEVGNYDK